ncbi:putative B3 domain-containing protein At1g78640 [Vicia villosa]|uniref:putative B3 domain-containing protein At1g78640 n=1 Tax=Vicia villosa TaxID=3911 RepID=UPI00273C1A10|nr:putative B3 domain-containing protein At1g78640 [Vicia villosa]
MEVVEVAALEGCDDERSLLWLLKVDGVMVVGGVTKKRKRGHQETSKNNKTNNVSSSLFDISSYPKTIVCLHLSLTVCTCLHETQIVEKQKRVQQETKVSTTNNTCTTVGTSSDCSTNVGDPWMIKKVLTKSDLDDNCRLLLNRDLAKKWVVPVVDKAKAANEGVEVEVFDVDTGFPLSLTFKIRPSNDSHVFNNTWITDFVDRRSLKKGDEIGLKWNEEKKRFDFSVLHRSDDN